MKRMIFIITIMCVAVCLNLMTCMADAGFSDIHEDSWERDSVMKMVDLGIISGYPDGSFRPNNMMTYGEFIKMAVIATTGVDPGASKDGEYWALNYYKEGVKIGLFNENEISSQWLKKAIPRVDMSLILSNAVGDVEIKRDVYNAIEKSISDMDYRSQNQYHVVKAYSLGLLTGYGDGRFMPQNSLRRSEASTVIYRLIDEEARVLPEIENSKGGIADGVEDDKKSSGVKAYTDALYEIDEEYIKGKSYEMRKTSEFCIDFLDYMDGKKFYDIKLFWTEDCRYFEDASALNVQVWKDWEESNHLCHTFSIETVGFTFIIKDGRIQRDVKRPFMGRVVLENDPTDFDYLAFVVADSAASDIRNGAYKKNDIDKFLVTIVANPFK